MARLRTLPDSDRWIEPRTLSDRTAVIFSFQFTYFRCLRYMLKYGSGYNVLYDTEIPTSTMFTPSIKILYSKYYLYIFLKFCCIRLYLFSLLYRYCKFSLVITSYKGGFLIIIYSLS